MGIECEGSMTPQADLAGFALAIAVTMSLAMAISGTTNSGEGPEVGSISARDLEGMIAWKGFDEDGSGSIDLPFVQPSDDVPGLPIEGSIVISVECALWSESLLFSDGKYVGNGSGLAPYSPVRSVTILIEFDGSIGPGMLSAFRTEVVV